MRDSARVFISQNGGTSWQLLATNNPTKSAAADDDSELPATPSASADATFLSNQHVQQLFRDGTWRQARIDLGVWAGQQDLRLRIDFSTAGMFDSTQKNAGGNLINTISGVANTTGDYSSGERGQNNNFEGFYVDDFIVGFAERGEMVTGAATGQTDFVTLPAAQPVANKVPAQNLQGQYQLEIRRGTEYGAQPSKQKSDVQIVGTFDTNAVLTLANGRLGDSNHPREQGQFIIEGNLVSNAKTYGISIDSGRDGATNAPSPGVVLNTAAPNSARLVPGVVVTNNVVAGSGTAGIRFSGDANSGAVPVAAVPFGRIVNNTIVGTAKAEGVGVLVNENAGPTLLNNLFANLGTGISVDASSQANTVVGTSAYWNTTEPIIGASQSQAITLGIDPFVDAARGNFYLKAGSSAIDSGLNSLPDRPAYTAVKQTLGIPDSPIIAPERDLYGQLRSDDPDQASQPGLGSNVFKDRGAIDRVDFTQPSIAMLEPLDNGDGDVSLAANMVQLEGESARSVSRLVFQLADIGIGIDDLTVTSAAFVVRYRPLVSEDPWSSEQILEAGIGYVFTYLENTKTVVFEAPAVFDYGQYLVVVDNAVIRDRAGNGLRNNDLIGDGTTAFAIGLSDRPSAPENLVAILDDDGAGNLSVTLTWTAAGANGDAVVSYTISGTKNGNTLDDIVVNNNGTTKMIPDLVADSLYKFRVRASNLVGTGGLSSEVEFVALPLPTFALENDSQPEWGPAGDNYTNDPTVVVSGIAEGEAWQYTTNGTAAVPTWVNGDPTTWDGGAQTFTFPLPNDGVFATGDIGVRRVVNSVPGGARFNAAPFTLDTVVARPTFALANDTGASATDGVTKDGTVSVLGIEAGARWRYSRDGGQNWIGNQTAASFVLPQGVYDRGDIIIEQTDLAGNTSIPPFSNPAQIVIDTTKPIKLGWNFRDNTGSQTDRITSNGTIDVTGLEQNATWELSLNSGRDWTSYGRALSFPLTEGVYPSGTIRVRQTDLAGNTGPSTSLPAITIDSSIATPTLTLAEDTGVSRTDRITSNGRINVSGLETGATWKWSQDNGVTWTAGAAPRGGVSSFPLQGDVVNVYPANSIQVRQTDKAGNESRIGKISYAITVDRSAAVPTAVLAEDTGNGPVTSYADNITRNGRINVGSLEVGSTWRYSVDNGQTWTVGTGTSFALAARATPYVRNTVWVQQTDRAGNVGTLKVPYAITVDQAPPAKPGLTLSQDTGTLGDGITGNGRINVSGLETGATWEWSRNSGLTWMPGAAPSRGASSFILRDGVYSANAIRVRQTDRAGNVGAIGSYPKAITVDSSAPTVAGVTSTLLNGVYGFGTTTVIPIRISFNEPVFVTGTPILALNTLPRVRNATYTGGSGTSTLTFTYTIVPGDSAADLGYRATTSLTGGTIVNRAGLAAVRALPGLGGNGSLDGSKNIGSIRDLHG